MEFKKEDLQELSYSREGDSFEEFEVVKNEISDTSRWSVHYYMIFKFKDKFYETGYSVGATESQDESAYEYAKDLIDCTEVEPFEKTITEYRALTKKA